MQVANALKIALILLAAPALTIAQQPPRLTVHTVKEGKLYWVEGGGGNSGVIIGKSGVIVVDAKTTVDTGRELVDEIAKITTKPIMYVIETHSDGDHVNGLAGFPDGLKIIAHVKNKQEQQAVFLYATVETDGGRCLPPTNRMPNETIFKDKVKTTLDGIPVTFLYFGPAHTSGDLVIYLPDERFAFAGDLITNSVLVHPEKMGSFAGWFRNANELISLNADYYLGGHASDLDTKTSLRKRVAEYQAIRDKVDGMIKHNSSLAEIKAAMGDPPKDRSGCRGIPYPSLAEVEYHERVNSNQELK